MCIRIHLNPLLKGIWEWDYSDIIKQWLLKMYVAKKISATADFICFYGHFINASLQWIYHYLFSFFLPQIALLHLFFPQHWGWKSIGLWPTVNIKIILVKLIPGIVSS